MPKTAHLNTRLEPELKEEAEAIFNQLGVKPSDAITMFYRQVIMHGGMPFPVRIPNEETRSAIAEKHSSLRGYKDADELMRDILKESN